MRPLVLFAMCALSYSVAAECVRYKPPPKGAPADFDGPGAWGELQDTVTLDCLRYVGSIERNGSERVQTLDERGKVQALQVDSFMGENTGVIVRIDADAIYVEQIVNRNGEWQPLTVSFAK
jgi:Tfp pilus assembly protein PilP